MADTAEAVIVSDLAEERLRLEREALQVERERLAAARVHAAAEAKLAARARHPLLAFVSIILLTLLAFAGGLMTGVALMEGRQQRQREERLAKALSQLPAIAVGESSTNAPAATGAAATAADRRNVSVLVIQ